MVKKVTSMSFVLIFLGCEDRADVEGYEEAVTRATSPQREAPGDHGPADMQGATVELPAVGGKNFPALPETVTKEFIMELWSRPHDGRDMIEEFADGQIREGVWKVISKRGRQKGEVIDTIESTMTLKMMDRRYQVWEWRDEEVVAYTVATYDHAASCYRWWGTTLGEDKIFEQSGRRWWRNLIEWTALNPSQPELESSMRTTFVSEDGKRFKVTGQTRWNGEVVSYSAGEFVWQSDLPEEHRDPEVEGF